MAPATSKKPALITVRVRASAPPGGAKGKNAIPGLDGHVYGDPLRRNVRGSGPRGCAPARAQCARHLGAAKRALSADRTLVGWRGTAQPPAGHALWFSRRTAPRGSERARRHLHIGRGSSEWG